MHSNKKVSQKRDFNLGLHSSHHLKNNPPKGRIPKRWDKNLVQEILPEGRIIDRILLIEGYLHVSTFYSVDDNADFTLLTLEVFELRVMEAVTLEGKEAAFMEWIQWSTQYDNPMVKALKALDAGELHSNEWTCTEGVVLYRGRVYVPDNPQLCHNLVHAHHGAVVAGHPR